MSTSYYKNENQMDYVNDIEKLTQSTSYTFYKPRPMVKIADDIVWTAKALSKKKWWQKKGYLINHIKSLAKEYMEAEEFLERKKAKD